MFSVEKVDLILCDLSIRRTSEKLRRILRSHKIRSTFYTENTLRKLLCKSKDRVATEDKNNTLRNFFLSVSFIVSVQVHIFAF